MGLFRSKPPSPETHAALDEAVGKALPDADDATRSIVGSCAGLLATVAYADRQWSEAEKQRVTELLDTVQGLEPQGRAAIVQVLQEHVVELATVQSSRFARNLKVHAERDLRRHVLDMLVDVAAADGDLSNDEVKLLRQLTAAMGLEQDDYNEAQAAHQEKLSVLKKPPQGS